MLPHTSEKWLATCCDKIHPWPIVELLKILAMRSFEPKTEQTWLLCSQVGTALKPVGGHQALLKALERFKDQAAQSKQRLASTANLA